MIAPSNPFNVAHIWQTFTPGLFDRTHDICLKHNLGSQIYCSQLVDNGSKIPDQISFLKKLSSDRHNSRSLSDRLKKKVFAFFEPNLFSKFLKQNLDVSNTDIFHFHFGHSALLVNDFIQKLIPQEKPLIVSFYGVDISAGIESIENQKLYKSIFDRQSLALVLCEESRQRLLKIGVAPGKILIWNLPPGIEDYPPGQKVPSPKIRFLMAARFVEKKGHRILLEAFARLCKQRNNVSLTLYGYGPSNWVQDLVDQLKLNDYCQVTNNNLSGNFQNEYRHLLQNHDIFLTPSIRARDGDDEGGPALTMILAQAAGLPVISTDFPGSEISMIHGKTGLVCKQNDENALFEALTQICDMSKSWSEMGHAGHDLVTEQFSIASQGRRLIEIYKKATFRDK